ncbi:MAG: hypothetical protein C0402_10515 [Thermodesulfovibrio sp.]|nr:hypothetical protein [Thermodesulfovibrio sp.]
MKGKVTVLFLLLVASIIVAGLLVCDTPADASAKNRNRKKAHRECVVCHISNTPGADVSLFPEGAEPSLVCLDCHNYTNSHHPIGFVPDRPLFSEDDENPLPLYNNEIRCLTCHQIHPENRTRKLLRGGPYADRREICMKCHYDEQYAAIDPHVMLDSNYQIKEVNGAPVCVICHTAVPEQEGVASKVNFKAEIAFLCWRCHPPMPDTFFKQHFLVRPSLSTLEVMRRTESEKGISFPLLNRGRVTCSTCHNPHQKGVIEFGPARAGEDEHDKLRMPPNEICSGCHDRK